MSTLNYLSRVRNGFRVVNKSVGPLSNWKAELGLRKRAILGAAKVLDYIFTPLKPEGDYLSRYRFYLALQGNTRRWQVYEKDSNHFNSSGIAITEKGRSIAAGLYQAAFDHFLRLCEAPFEVENRFASGKVKVRLIPLFLFGSLAEKKGRLGVLLPPIVPQTGPEKSHPSDIDIAVKYELLEGSAGSLKERSIIFEGLRFRLGMDLEREYGIHVHVVAEEATEAALSTQRILIEQGRPQYLFA